MVLEEELPLSKSEIKRQIQQVKALGTELSQLSAGDLKKMPLTDEALDAVIELKNIKSNVAKKRQTQFLAKLLGQQDNINEIKSANEGLTGQVEVANAEFHLIEQWRDNLIADSAKYITEFMNTFENVSSQELRHLVQKALKEKKQGTNHGAYKMLFRFIKPFILD